MLLREPPSLHSLVVADDSSRARQLGALNSVVSSRHGQAYLAEAYTGWPTAYARLT
jgi:p-hydroxybenzoate 3-monooxygenase